jgi:hypothetical protein
MSHTINSIFSRVCKWCGKAKFELPSRVLLCPQCDYANKDTIIPKLDEQP